MYTIHNTHTQLHLFILSFLFLSFFFSFTRKKKERKDRHTYTPRTTFCIVCHSLLSTSRLHKEKERNTHAHTKQRETHISTHIKKHTGWHWCSLCVPAVYSRGVVRARLLSSQVRSSNSRVLRLKISSLSI